MGLANFGMNRRSLRANGEAVGAADAKFDSMQSQDEEPRLTVDKGSALESVAAYRLAVEASEEGWDDATIMKAEPLLADAAPQLVRAIGSIAANIAEGYARRSARDRIRYYEYALGSVEESSTWY